MRGRERKIKEIEELVSLIDSYPVVGVVNLYKMPSAQLQEIRKILKNEAKIRMSKKTLLKFAFEKSKKRGIKKLKEFLRGQPALILTKTNPFKLFKFLNENKTSAPAKAGDIAPEDIIVREGDTGLPPGPAISQLGEVGIPTKVQDGKIYIIKDTKVASEGEEISPQLANVLNILGLKPMKIGLDLIAIYENGIIFDKDVLKIDEEEFLNRLTSCITVGIHLSLECSYITPITAPLMIREAYLKARTLAMETGIYVKDVIEDLILKAYLEGEILKNT